MNEALPNVILSQDVLNDLRDWVARTRLPVTRPRFGDVDGVDRVLPERLLERWRDRFDWRAREAR